MIISHDKKFIFIHIPRTGGTVISKSICKSMGIDNWKSFIGEPKRLSPYDHPLEPEGFDRGWKRGYKHFTAKEAKKRVGKNMWKSYFKFTFVRNPWDRTISMYLKKRKECPKLVKKLWPKNKTIFNFLVQARYGIMDKESHQQLDSLEFENGSLDIDFVGKYENIKKDFGRVCSEIGVNASLVGEHDATQHRNYKNYYNKTTKKIILEKNKDDIEYFEYSF
jgi:hypothetical protein